jgi:RNA polymerase sigma factor (sigma-70 family)
VEASALHAPAYLGRRLTAGPLLRLRSDDQLVALFRMGYDDAFGVIHDRYRQRLFSYTRQMLPGARSDAEDVLQDVFLRAYSALREDDRPVTLRAWLYRVAHNRCVDQLRRPVPAASEVYDMSRLPLRDPLVETQMREDLRRLVSDVQRLPEQQRSALLMRELDGLSYAELADALGVTVPAVKSLLVRARMSLMDAGEARDAPCADIRADLSLAHDRGVRVSGRSRRHLRDCPGCRGYKRALGSQRAGFGALAGGGPWTVIAKLLGIGGAGSGAAVGGGAMGGSGAAVGGGVVAGGGGAAVAGGGAVVAKVAVAVCCAAVTAGGATPIEHRLHHHPRTTPAAARPAPAAARATSAAAAATAGAVPAGAGPTAGRAASPSTAAPAAAAPVIVSRVAQPTVEVRDRAIDPAVLVTRHQTQPTGGTPAADPPPATLAGPPATAPPATVAPSAPPSPIAGAPQPSTPAPAPATPGAAAQTPAASTTAPAPAPATASTPASASSSAPASQTTTAAPAPAATASAPAPGQDTPAAAPPADAAAPAPAPASAPASDPAAATAPHTTAPATHAATPAA